MTPENCPACGRELSEPIDFPRIEVKRVELFPLPEKILHWSSARSEALEELKEEDLPEELRGARIIKPVPHRVIDLTGQIKEVLNLESVQQYLQSLQQKVGSEVDTTEILPTFKKSGYFQGIYSIPNSNYFLSLRNQEGEENIATLTLWGHGPNYGSGGGPTLTAYADLAMIEYQGRLLTGVTV